jgi:WD40 repeat protein
MGKHDNIILDSIIMEVLVIMYYIMSYMPFSFLHQFTDGGQRIMNCSLDGSLRVWNLKRAKQIGKDWRDGESRVSNIALSPDRKKVVSGSDDGAVRLWDIDTCKVIVKWTGHTKTVWSVCWSEDGWRILSESLDARQWDVENERQSSSRSRLNTITCMQS